MKQQDIWKKWLEDNWLYVYLGMEQDDNQRQLFIKLKESCDKHGVSFKTVTDILCEVYG